jgi:hypothetical protein
LIQSGAWQEQVYEETKYQSSTAKKTNNSKSDSGIGIMETLKYYDKWLINTFIAKANGCLLKRTENKKNIEYIA